MKKQDDLVINVECESDAKKANLKYLDRKNNQLMSVYVKWEIPSFKKGINIKYAKYSIFREYRESMVTRKENLEVNGLHHESVTVL